MQTERELEVTVVANLEMIEAGLRLVGRHSSVAGDWLDLLGIESDGDLAILNSSVDDSDAMQ